MVQAGLRIHLQISASWPSRKWSQLPQLCPNHWCPMLCLLKAIGDIVTFKHTQIWTVNFLSEAKPPATLFMRTGLASSEHMGHFKSHTRPATGQPPGMSLLFPRQTYVHGFCFAFIVTVWGRECQQDWTHFVFNIVLENQILLQKNQEHFLAWLSNLEEEKGKGNHRVSPSALKMKTKLSQHSTQLALPPLCHGSGTFRHTSLLRL